MSIRLSTPEDYEGLLDKYDTWMFDCDGVLWSGDHSIDGAIQVLDILRSRSEFESRCKIADDRDLVDVCAVRKRRKCSL